jgi:predicted permease
MLETVAYNLRYALRQFASNRSFALTVILTASLGIGLNTAMFSVIRGVLLSPLGYHDPDRLVVFANGATPIRFEQTLYSARSYDGLGAYMNGMEALAFSGKGEPVVLKGARVSANFLDILGVQPLRGRSFLPDEDKPGAPPVAMISEQLWEQRFTGTPSIQGQTITLAGTAYTIVGVLPAKFQFPFPGADVWLTRPSEASGIPPQSRPLSPVLRIFGRLKPGVDIAHADAELLVIDRQYDLAHPGMLDSNKAVARRMNRPSEHVERLRDSLVSDVRLKLWLLFGAVGLVLMIVCANIASLLLARATARSREFAVRAAIGASRKAILGQLLSESALLSMIGGTLGIALAELSVGVLRGMTALELPRSGEIRIDGPVLLFAVALSLLAGLVFGLAPALSASRPDLAEILRGTGEAASVPGPLRIHPRSLLVVGQVALSTVLLVSAALLIESLARVYRVDPGFQVSHLLTMRLSPSPVRYDTTQKRAAFYQSVIDQINSLPGVNSAAITRTLPLTGWAAAPIQVIGQAELKLNERPLAIIQNVSSQYFQTMKIPLKRGRNFAAGDDATAELVAIIDETMARQFWPQYPAGADPIGQRVLIGTRSQPITIVGIVADIRQVGLTEPSKSSIYLAAAQQPPEAAMLAIRVQGDPLAVVNAVRHSILTLDRDQPVSDVASMNEVVDESEGELQVMLALLGVFAAMATIIALIGLYGVINYSVAQRTKEIGIRRALGAQRQNIFTLILRDGLRLAMAGVLLGLGGALIFARLLQGLLFHISSTDPLTYLGIAFLFSVIALAASYVPAQRAAAIDPLAALRSG